MQFLLAAVRKNRRRIRIEQWLLLAIRTLVVILVVTAMAKPFLETFGAVIAGPADPSGAGARRLAQHGIHVGRIEPLRPGEGAGGAARQGFAAGRCRQRDPDGRPAQGRDRRSLHPTGAKCEKEIDELALSHGGTDLAATFEKVDGVLEVSPISQKEVVFLTDLQAASWRPPAEAADTIKRLLARVEDRQAALGS